MKRRIELKLQGESPKVPAHPETANCQHSSVNRQPSTKLTGMNLSLRRMTEAKTVAFHTLGCKLNFSETSSISRLMEKEGFEKKPFDGLADIYVINTCSVTENADKECRYLVRQIQRKSPESFIVITGCYAQLKPKEIAEIPGVDLVLGAAEKFNMATHIRELVKGDPAKICSCDIEQVQDFHSGYSFNDRTRAFLKVQDGCDYSCSFCTIPLARGKSRSDSLQHVLENVRELASKGIQEIVLTGVNLGDFRDADHGVIHSVLPYTNPLVNLGDFPNTHPGTIPDNFPSTNLGDNPRDFPSTHPGPKRRTDDFFALAQSLDQVKEMPRFRISSIEPNLLNNDIIELVANSDRFMPHFHVPLQSGSNKILALMRRRYQRELYADRVARIKTLMPHAAIGADVIVGFPGETDEDFEETRNFLHSLDLSYLHVFTYSERENTRAIGMRPVVPMNIRHERNKILRTLSFQKLQYFTAQHAGQTRKVLFERSRDKAMMEGYTDNYIKVTVPFQQQWVNTIVDWKL